MSRCGHGGNHPRLRYVSKMWGALKSTAPALKCTLYDKLGGSLTWKHNCKIHEFSMRIMIQGNPYPLYCKESCGQMTKFRSACLVYTYMYVDFQELMVFAQDVCVCVYIYIDMFTYIYTCIYIICIYTVWEIKVELWGFESVSNAYRLLNATAVQNPSPHFLGPRRQQ